MSSLEQANEVYNKYGAYELMKRGISEGLRHLSAPYENLQTEDQWVGAKYYGNFAGFHNNFGGNLAETKCRTASGNPPQIETTQESEELEAAMELRHNGYTKIGNIYDEDVIDEVVSRYNNIIENKEHTKSSHSNDPGDGNVYIRGIDSPQEEYFPEAEQLVTEKVKNILRNYYRSHIQIRNLRAYRTHHIPPELMESKEVYNNHWHCDGKTSDHIKLFVCLGETTEEDGPLHIMPKKYTREYAKRNASFDRETDGAPNNVVEEHGEPVKFTGVAGDVMLANTQTCLHRAGVPDEGRSRDLVQLYIAPSSEPLPENWIDSELEGADPNVWSRLLKY
ncbi:phytanoyl-CoA dioxygenase family protein [Halovenus rubra]|uniref:Phytanoyl-CoA dioxygenase family protein n=2 Tax=Halovenus rubra TaxID=869890 RepID=A0ABD5X1L9_9EURY|nr:phytanoyl-CoA dioxygenase family protein [Halovenus rubra]